MFLGPLTSAIAYRRHPPERRRRRNRSSRTDHSAEVPGPQRLLSRRSRRWPFRSTLRCWSSRRRAQAKNQPGESKALFFNDRVALGCPRRRGPRWRPTTRGRIVFYELDQRQPWPAGRKPPQFRRVSHVLVATWPRHPACQLQFQHDGACRFGVARSVMIPPHPCPAGRLVRHRQQRQGDAPRGGWLPSPARPASAIIEGSSARRLPAMRATFRAAGVLAPDAHDEPAHPHRVGGAPRPDAASTVRAFPGEVDRIA
jgi:hypothetical protein